METGEIAAARLHAEPDPDPGRRQPHPPGLERLRVVLLAGDAGGHAQLPADLVGRLVQGHHVAALGGGQRRLEPGGPGTDDSHLAGAALDHRLQHQLGLVPRAGVDQAAGALAVEDLVQAGLVAGDAGDDLVAAALGELVRQLGVGQQRPGHGDEIGLAVGEDLLGDGGGMDPVGGDHRHVHQLAQGGGVLDEGRARHRGDDRGHPGLVPADPGGEHIHPALDESLGQRCRLLPGLAAGDEVQQGDAVAEQRIGAERLAHGGGHRERHCPSAVGTAPPAVPAPVRGRGQELVEQISLRAHDLDAVVAGLDRVPGRLGEVLDGAAHSATGQPAGPERGERGLPGPGGGGQRVEGVAARVEQLEEDAAVGLMDFAGDHLVAAQGARIGLASARGEAAGAVGGVAAGDDQPRAAAGAFAEVGGELLDVAGAVLEPDVHGSHHDAVPHLERSEIQRREQPRIGTGHDRVRKRRWHAAIVPATADRSLGALRTLGVDPCHLTEETPCRRGC